MSYPPRSSELMNASDTAMLVVDVQQKLIPVIQSHEQLVWNIGRLLRAAEALQIQTAATEQYPQGLGSTIDLGGPMPTMIEEKTMFSCREADSIFSQWANAGIRKILVCGIETHVCVQQPPSIYYRKDFESTWPSMLLVPGILTIIKSHYVAWKQAAPS
tara:strand:- start:1890 stop:2366 length:477 start_codon:yes stop_codon:yes gene_type:complete